VKAAWFVLKETDERAAFWSGPLQMVLCSAKLKKFPIAEQAMSHPDRDQLDLSSLSTNAAFAWASHAVCSQRDSDSGLYF